MYPFISIIVPVYNVEKYLAKCIESILSQSFSDFELLLINDGSKDNSGKICDEYALKDSRIKVFHKENSGVSAARNIGIEIASGIFISFVDSDDWVTPTYLSDFNITSDDFYFQGLQNWYENNDNIKLSEVEDNGNKDFISLFVNNEYNSLLKGPCAKLFRRDLLNQFHIRFNQILSYGEDHIFVMEYLLKCNSIRGLNVHNYFYAHRNIESLTTRIVPPQQLYIYIEEILKYRNIIIDQRKITSSSYKNFIKEEMASHICRLINSLYQLRQKKAERTKMISKILVNSNFMECINDARELPPFYKLIKYLLSFNNDKMVDVVLRNIHKIKSK